MHDQDLQIRYFDMAIDGLEGKYLVAKLRRVSSSPVLQGSVSDTFASALGRLTDIFRLGTQSRNFADIKAIEGFLLKEFGVTADQEWDAYLREIRRVIGIERLDVIQPFLLTPEPGQSDHPVVFHSAEMNDRPYLVARIGDILGSPAATLLTFPNEERSALARLLDVFRVGVRGQMFRDFVEFGRKKGRREEDILGEWKVCEQAVAQETGSE